MSGLLALGFCGFYGSGSGAKLVNDATQVVLFRDGTRTVLAMQNDYKGPLEDFAMVVPVPVVLKQQDVKTLPKTVFEHVESLGSPRLVEYWEQDPCPYGFDDTNIYGGLLGNEVGEMNGGFGFGRSGFGPGGGGVGWGTIGTGRYGTIGHGSGTGSGYGVGSGRGGMRGRQSAVPQVRIGQPQSVGDLDKAIIRRYIKRNIQKISYCYEKQLLAQPTLEGTVATQFFISPTGVVAESHAKGVTDEVASCVA